MELSGQLPDVAQLDEDKEVPVKLNNETVGKALVKKDGTFEIVFNVDDALVRQLTDKIAENACAGLALLPVRMPSPPRPEFGGALDEHKIPPALSFDPNGRLRN